MFSGVLSVDVDDTHVFSGKIFATFVAGNIGGKIITRGVVHGEHFKRSGSAAFLLEAMSTDARRTGVICEDIFEIVWVAVEVGDNWFVGGEVVVKNFLRHFLFGSANGTVGESVDANKAEVAVWEILVEDVNSANSFTGSNVAGGGDNVIWVIVGGKAIDTGAVFILEGGMVFVDPDRLFGLVECCKIYNVF